MKKIIFFAVAIFTISLTSCTSKSGQRIKLEKKMQANADQEQRAQSINLDAETLSELNSVFENNAVVIRDFVSTYGNDTDSYQWISENSKDRYYPALRLHGMNSSKNSFIIEQRPDRLNARTTKGYEVGRTKINGQFVYFLEYTFFRNGKEIKARRKYFVIASGDELVAALKPFQQRLKEA